MNRQLATLMNVFALTMPHFVVSKLFLLGYRENNNLWKTSPLRFLKSPIMLPNGYQILWSWSQDPFWLKDITQEVYYDETYEHFFSVKEKDTVVDVGANIGLFSLKASKTVGEQGKVVSFEPEKNNYEALRRNLRINHCKNVTPINAAASNFDGKADFFIADALVDHKLVDCETELNPNIMGSTKVNVRTIQTVLKEHGIGEVDFLKVDAEGAELEVLEGARNLLMNKTIKKISVAVYHTKNQPKIIGDYMRQFGYNVLFLRTVGLADFQKIHAYGFVGSPDLKE